MSRISGGTDGDSPRLDPAKVLSFFERRAARIPELGPTRAVIYQDHHPSLAERRDAHERRFLAPYLRLDGTQRLLDIACGTGRWTRTLAPLVSHYHGVDFARGLIEHARQHYERIPNVRFSIADASDFTLASLGEESSFDRVLSSGLLIYLNDDQVDSFLRCLVDATTNDALILLREPVAQEERLTLVDHPSIELESDYHAVYRTRAELLEAMSPSLTLIDHGRLYNDPDLNNRTETIQEWFVLTPGEPT